MKKSFLIFVMFFVWNLFSAQKNFLDQPYIEVSALVDTLVVPDRIYVSITLNEADSKNKKSVEEQEKQLETILKKLKIKALLHFENPQPIDFFLLYSFLLSA